MSSCIAMRGGLKSDDREGATKKRVRFVDDATMTTVAHGGLEEDETQSAQGITECELEKAPSLAEVGKNVACGVDIHAQVAANLMQEGLNLQESCHATDKCETSGAVVKDVKDAVNSCELVGDCVERESPSTPPSRTICGSRHRVPHSQLQVSGVQRKLTFVAGAASEQCHSKFRVTNRKNLSKSLNFYKVAPEVEESALAMNVSTARGLAFQEDACKKRCAWITPQSDAVYVAYHDEEWGVPLHDDRRLFELLVFAGAQAEIAWSTLLAKREVYRNVFAQFDPTILATYDMTKEASLRSHNDLMRSEARVQSIIHNAKLVIKIVEEYGSFDAYLWGFVGNKPIVNRYKQANLIPVRTAKSEAISKDLQRRGFRHAGPIVVYSLMQAAGLANDHLLSCFRHHILLPSPSSPHPLSLRKPTPSTRKPLVSPLCG